MIVPLVRALRPKQWLKNSFCLAPLIFSKQALNLEPVIETGLVFLSFSMLASTVYLINDIFDRERDRAHPVKKNRPIASGALAVWMAVVSALLIGGGGLALGVTQSMTVVSVLGGYLVMNLCYSFWLKHLVIVDLLVISIGFVLRVMAGAAAIGVEPSQWILTCTLFISLLLAACKRRSEVELQGPDSGTRKVLSHYSVRFLDLIISVVAGGAILSYALYTVSPQTSEHVGSTNLIYTMPFVLFAVFRYIYLVLENAKGESPFNLLVRDIPIMIDILGYVIVTFAVMYLL